MIYTGYIKEKTGRLNRATDILDALSDAGNEQGMTEELTRIRELALCIVNETYVLEKRHNLTA